MKALKQLRILNGDASHAELLRQAIHWEATRAWWHARKGNLEAAADAEDRATFYTKQYNELPDRAHRYLPPQSLTFHDAPPPASLSPLDWPSPDKDSR